MPKWYLTNYLLGMDSQDFRSLSIPTFVLVRESYSSLLGREVFQRDPTEYSRQWSSISALLLKIFSVFFSVQNPKMFGPPTLKL